MVRICLQGRRLGFDPWVGKIPWRGGHGNPLQYSCLENPQGQRSLMGYSRTRLKCLSSSSSIKKNKAKRGLERFLHDVIAISNVVGREGLIRTRPEVMSLLVENYRDHFSYGPHCLVGKQRRI